MLDLEGEADARNECTSSFQWHSKYNHRISSFPLFLFFFFFLLSTFLLCLFSSSLVLLVSHVYFLVPSLPFFVLAVSIGAGLSVSERGSGVGFLRTEYGRSAFLTSSFGDLGCVCAHFRLVQLINQLPLSSIKKATIFICPTPMILACMSGATHIRNDLSSQSLLAGLCFTYMLLVIYLFLPVYLSFFIL